MNIELHIENLLLPEIAQGSEHQISLVMERELMKLIETEGLAHLPWLMGNLRKIDAGAVKIYATTPADTMGSLLAQSVYRGLREGSAAR